MKHIKICMAICVVAFGLSSCGIYGKYTPQHPEADSITTPAYTEIFTDPMLQGLIEKALMQNLDLKAAHERVNQANASLLGSKLAYVPSIGLGAEAGQTGQFGGETSSVGYQVGVTAGWNFDLFGRLYNQMKMANASRLSAVDMEQLYRAELIASVANHYYQLLMLDAQIETVDSIGNTFRNQVDALKAMKEAGMTDEAAVAQYEGNMYGVLAQAKQLRLARHEVENALRMLLSDPNYGEIRRTNLVTTTQGYDLLSIPLSAVLTRPDVRKAEHLLEHAHYGVQLSRSNCCPNISLSGMVGFNGSFIFSWLGNLLQPIFNSGKNIAEVRSAKAARQEALYGYESALVKAAVDVNNAMAARKSYHEQTEDMLRRKDAFERAYDATSTKFRLGQGSYLESLIALQQLLDARNGLIENYSQILQAQVELYIALGGGN